MAENRALETTGPEDDPGVQRAERPRLSECEARQLTDEVRQDADRLLDKIERLHAGGAHTALGYASWAEYAYEEFGHGRSRAYQLLQHALVRAHLLNLPESKISDWGREWVDRAQASHLAEVARAPAHVQPALADEIGVARRTGVRITAKTIAELRRKVLVDHQYVGSAEDALDALSQVGDFMRQGGARYWGKGAPTGSAEHWLRAQIRDLRKLRGLLNHAEALCEAAYQEHVAMMRHEEQSYLPPEDAHGGRE